MFEEWHTSRLKRKVDFLRQRPYYSSLAKDWIPTYGETSRNLFRESLELTSFALDQFKQRTDRDGTNLAILATHRLASFATGLWPPIDQGKAPIDLLKDMAEAKGIPLIDLRDYVIRRGGKIEELHFMHDFHWNETGHRWAAEALLEYLDRNQAVCGPGPTVELALGSALGAPNALETFQGTRLEPSPEPRHLNATFRLRGVRSSIGRATADPSCGSPSLGRTRCPDSWN